MEHGCSGGGGGGFHTATSTHMGLDKMDKERGQLKQWQSDDSVVCLYSWPHFVTRPHR